MREYGAIPTRFWSDPPIKALSDQAKLLAAYLLTGPHTNMLGCFRLPTGYVAEDFSWSFATVSKRFKELLTISFVTRDRDTGWLVIHPFLDWNPIENPNQGKSTRKLFEQIPPNTRILPLITHILLQHKTHLEEEFQNRLQTLSQQFRNQDQEQDQDQNQDQEQEVSAMRKSAATVLAPLPAVITIPLNDRSEFFINQSRIEEWQNLYPAIDVLQTLRHIRGWNLANPKKRKTKNGILRHITQWLANEQNKSGAHAKAKPPLQSLADYNKAITQQWLQSDETAIVNGGRVYDI